MTAVDAQTYWMSAKIPSDQFLLYAFDGVTDADAAIGDLLRRARACPDLSQRVVDDRWWAYPRWVQVSPREEQFRVCESDLDWPDCLDAVAGLAEGQLDARESTWRAHVFSSVAGVPNAAGLATVLVLQVAHALADGSRAAQLAAWLLGRSEPVPAIPERRRGPLVLRGFTAARAHRQLVRDIETGALPAAPDPQPPLPTNASPAGRPRLRTLVLPRRALADGHTVTVGALLVIGEALAQQLGEPAGLAAEVPLRKPGIRYARNHFRNVSIGLRPDLPRAERAEALRAQLSAARRRAEHPAARAESDALAAAPAALLRWGVRQFDATVRAPAVTGHTVVSSVNRGDRDLSLGGAAVLLTAGYPALSPMMSLTHGVHGIGDAVALSVHAGSDFDIDGYLGRLASRLA